MNGTPCVLGILIVDDNEPWTRAMKSLIENRLPSDSREVRVENNLRDGIKASKTFHSDFVLLDIDLPDSRPHETMGKIGLFPEPVYALSDHFQRDNPSANVFAMEAIKAGARRAYPKDSDTMSWLVSELVQTHVYNTLRKNGAT